MQTYRTTDGHRIKVIPRMARIFGVFLQFATYQTHPQKVPEGEIWIDACLSTEEQNAILKHLGLDRGTTPVKHTGYYFCTKCQAKHRYNSYRGQQHAPFAEVRRKIPRHRRDRPRPEPEEPEEDIFEEIPVPIDILIENLEY